MPWNRLPWRVRAPFMIAGNIILLWYLFHRVALLESAALSGWYTSSKAKYWHETDSVQVPWGKDAKNFEKRVKQCVKPLKGKPMSAVSRTIGVLACNVIYVGCIFPVLKRMQLIFEWYDGCTTPFGVSDCIGMIGKNCNWVHLRMDVLQRNNLFW